MYKLVGRLLLIAMFGFVLGCTSPEVEYPENPTPPPGDDPVTTSTPQPGQDG